MEQKEKHILITGSEGFLGKNLVLELKNQGYYNLYEFDKNSNLDLLNEYCSKADFVFHLAGVNRSNKESDYFDGNFDLTKNLLETLNKVNSKASIMLSSSIQAEGTTAYSLSKKKAEDILKNYGLNNGVKIYIYRYSNIFGKFSRPNYNSVIATFCYNISRGIDIRVDNVDTVIPLIYIDDVVENLLELLEKDSSNIDYNNVQLPQVYKKRLGDIVELIQGFRDSRESSLVPNLSDDFIKKLYSTYISFLPKDKFNYELKSWKDNRGSFTEFLKSDKFGQVSINVAFPGVS